jgi:DNA-binding phage protein
MRITNFDAVKYLDSPEAICRYLQDALDTHDAAFIARAAEMVVRALRRDGILSSLPLPRIQPPN